ncbi:hypothetical protein D9758_006011 [Tetrapyrgos nigripes]|uniref:Uncharacterized protein n=1 Tax=Tetrapyrgos nigripes TaxID=182062 RepID=A0A8H5G094_9AGAR|nr:hypothetical protein D9758_006011 [Tetrapyrgos nigripes]
MPTNSPLGDFNPLAEHPFTSCASSSPNPSPLSSPTPSPLSAPPRGQPFYQPSPTHPQPPASQPIFVPFRQGAHSPDLNDILRKKPASSFTPQSTAKSPSS